MRSASASISPSDWPEPEPIGNTVGTRAETTVVSAAALVQGIALVTFPAASSIFTSPSHYGLSTTQYGSMFLPQVVTAITASLLGARLARRYGLKRVFVVGLLADLVSMGLLVTSQFFTSTQALAYGLLLVATAALRRWFRPGRAGAEYVHRRLPSRRCRQSGPRPQRAARPGDRAGPVFVALFVGVGAWWGLPVMTGVLLVGLVATSLAFAAPPCGHHSFRAWHDGGAGPPPCTFLALRRVRCPLRHLRDA